jgi:hypothetical protein
VQVEEEEEKRHLDRLVLDDKNKTHVGKKSHDLTLYLRNRGDSTLSDCGHELRQ